MLKTSLVDHGAARRRPPFHSSHPVFKIFQFVDLTLKIPQFPQPDDEVREYPNGQDYQEG